MRYVVAFGLTFLWLAPVGAAEIYIYCNAQGLECSDRPSSKTSIVRSGGTTRGAIKTTAAAEPDARTSTSTSAGSAGDKVQQQREQQAALDKAQQELKKDLTDKRTEQCKQAQDYYRKSVDAQVIFKVDKAGVKQTLSDKEADQTRLNAKIDMDRTCAQAGS